MPTEDYRAAMCAPLTDYEAVFETVMTARYGPDWATRANLPDEAFTAEVVFTERLSALHDHIDTIAGHQLRNAAVQRHLDRAGRALHRPTVDGPTYRLNQPEPRNPA